MSDIVEDYELDKAVLSGFRTKLLEYSELEKLQRKSKGVCIGADVDEMGVEEDNDGGGWLALVLVIFKEGCPSDAGKWGCPN